MPENTPTEQEHDQKSDYQSIADFISNTDLMLNNAKDSSQISAKMIAAGYTVAEVETQIGQVAELRVLNEAQAAEYGDQFAATQAWHDAKAAIHDTYIDHLGLARLVFKKDKAAKHELKLSEERKPSQGGYIDQALFFYDGVLNNAAYKTALAAKSITLTDLTAGKAAFENLQVLRRAQQKETSEAQTATRDRDAVYDDLHEWVTDFRATMKIVLRQSPELMEALGIVQPS